MTEDSIFSVTFLLYFFKMWLNKKKMLCKIADCKSCLHDNLCRWKQSAHIGSFIFLLKVSRITGIFQEK